MPVKNMMPFVCKPHMVEYREVLQGDDLPVLWWCVCKGGTHE